MSLSFWTIDLILLPNFSLIIPTHNAGKDWKECLDAIKRQSIQPISIIVVDSSSTDATVQIAKTCNCKVVTIEQKLFGHGKTRQMALRYAEGSEIVVFMTQDAVLADVDSLRNIIDVFQCDRVGAAYGRQLPKNNAGSTEIHAREYNYPAEPLTKSFSDVERYGIKLTFLSNAFAAYRINLLNKIGGFPLNAIISEDVYVGSKLLIAGYNIHYCSEATVYHSHNYSLVEFFQRYFDIGVFYSRESWIQERFGKTENEGRRYLVSQFKYLWRYDPLLLPLAFMQTLSKWIGYKMGYHEKLLPNLIKRYLSMHKGYWRHDG